MEMIRGLLSLFAYSSAISSLGDIVSKLLGYLKYKAIYEFVCENVRGEVLELMPLCLLISFEITLIYIKLKRK